MLKLSNPVNVSKDFSKTFPPVVFLWATQPQSEQATACYEVLCSSSPPVIFQWFFKTNYLGGSTGPISPYGRCLITELTVFFQSLRGCCQSKLARNFRVKIGKISLLTFIRLLGNPNGVEYRNSNVQKFNDNDLATSYKNLVYFGPVTEEFMRVKGIHPSSGSSLAMFAWQCHC